MTNVLAAAARNIKSAAVNEEDIKMLADLTPQLQELGSKIEEMRAYL
jgi:hypothetical protein